MAIRGYVLVETDVGRTQAVGDAIRQITPAMARIIAVDTGTGPFDVIVQLEADDLDKLGKSITKICKRSTASSAQPPASPSTSRPLRGLTRLRCPFGA